jgi:hypothetical protein
MRCFPKVSLIPRPVSLTVRERRAYGVSFSTDIAGLVSDQLSRFVTLNRHQLAGQVANLDFWLAQVRHALAALDGYGVRFVRMSAAQEQYLATDGGTTECKPSPPRRVPDRELRKARRALTEAAFRFLDRCRREGLISESQFTEASQSLNIE